MKHRPSYPRPDKTSHAVVRDWLKARGCVCAKNSGTSKWYYGGHYYGYPLSAIDISAIGGMVDWIVVLANRVCAAWECKEPGKRNRLTAAEQEFMNVMTLYVITDEHDCETAAYAMVQEML